MLKLFANGGLAKKRSTAEIHLQRNMAELVLEKNMALHTTDDFFNFEISIVPEEGYYRHAHVRFSFTVSQEFPHKPPKIKCLTKLFHPNIDLEGNICLNILREDWSPILGIQQIVMGLNFLLTEPNPDDPLNKKAGEMLRTDKSKFDSVVRSTLKGYAHDGESFPRLCQ
jgi:ubiquitin-protein ligase